MPNIIRAIPVQLIRAILVVLFIFGFGSLTACGGGGGGNSVAAPTPPPPVTAPTAEQIALVDQAVGEGVTREELYRILLENNIAQREYFEQRLRELGQLLQQITAPITVTQPPLTVTVTTTPGIPPQTVNLPMTLITTQVTATTPITRVTGDVVTQVTATTAVRYCVVIFLGHCRQYNTDIGIPPRTVLATLFVTMTNVVTSYSPNMHNVVHAVMADTFHRGIAIGESNFAFSGRYNGNDRAAGFTYDMGGFALRTDYIRLPSKQDGEVMLDTYRFGIVRPINDEARFFAGVDSYRNAILALDVNGDNLHRFGIAAGDGYAVRYEFRVRL